MKKLLAILLVLALSLGMLPMALADEPTVLTIGSIITKRETGQECADPAHRRKAQREN